MSHEDSKVLYLTAGAGGMFCGSCMHDNALARALSEHGWNVNLVATYTPIRTDESDFSVDQVLFGGINVYLQQKIPLLRYVPAFLDRFLDSPWLIRKVTSKAMETDAKMLGQLAVSMLKGTRGNQVKEVKKLCKWIRLSKPKLIIFSNVLIGGCIEQLKKELSLPILVTLQGDDVFLDSLKEPYRQQCIDEINRLVPYIDGFIVQSEFFRDYMSRYFQIPHDKLHVTPLGIDCTEFEEFIDSPKPTSDSFTIGYMARLAKEKGLHHLVDAFIKLKSQPGTDSFKLRIAGWLSEENKPYAQEQWEKLDSANLSDSYEYLGSIERNEKLDFFRSIDVLTVPTEFLEPKGLYALESLASGIPVVLPDHGAFPELVEQSNGGRLYPAGNDDALISAWRTLATDHELRNSLARQGQVFVHAHRNGKSMAESTSLVLKKFL